MQLNYSGTIFSNRQRKASGFTLLELLVVISIVLFMLAFMVGIFLKQGDTNRIRATQKLIERIGIGLARYYADLRTFPPDTAYGQPLAKVMGTINAAGDTGVVYDSYSLWRYLGAEIQQFRPNGAGGTEYWRTLGPYIKFNDSELVEDPPNSKQFYVVDAWNKPLGYVGDPRRVIHNRGDCDLYSGGPNKKTASDDGLANSTTITSGTANTSYVGGSRYDASELGESALNGTLTVTKRDHMNAGSVQFAGEVLDDINNWDPQK